MRLWTPPAGCAWVVPPARAAVGAAAQACCPPCLAVELSWAWSAAAAVRAVTNATRGRGAAAWPREGWRRRARPWVRRSDVLPGALPPCRTVVSAAAMPCCPARGHGGGRSSARPPDRWAARPPDRPSARPPGRWAARPPDRWAARPPDRPTARPLGRPTVRPPGRWAAGPLGRWAAGPLGRWAAGPLGRWAAGPLGR
ncbi:hypothetical protein ACFY36_12140, partial [Actinoplanes sp. NPDC000266]